MYTQPIVLRYESAEAFETLRRGYHADFAPADRHQAILVDRMAAAAWRLRRLDSLTADTIEQARANPGSEESARALIELRKFQSAQSRIYIRTFRKLRLSQAAAQCHRKNPDNEPEFSAFYRVA